MRGRRRDPPPHPFSWKIEINKACMKDKNNTTIAQNVINVLYEKLDSWKSKFVYEGIICIFELLKQIILEKTAITKC